MFQSRIAPKHWRTLQPFLYAFWALCLAPAAGQGVPTGPLGPNLPPGDHFGVPGVSESYDYVVVGGGTAGNAIARRLAEDPSVKSVALIEAGGFYQNDNGNRSEIPAYASYFLAAEPRNPLIDWYQFTTPQPELGNRAVKYTIGKTLGGGSARNFLWYMRSSAGAYKKWADEVGDISYSYTNLIRFFKKSVQFNPPTNADRPANASIDIDPGAFGAQGGPLQVSFSAWVNGISSWFANALGKLGLQQLRGFVDGSLLGFSYIPETLTRDQVRSSSESSFLQEAFEKTKGLRVYNSTLATQIIFDEKKQATGVKVNTEGSEYELRAKREVILSAGALRSPQLLMVSGVGPCSDLSKLQIECVSDLPGVGQNLQDHVFFGPAYAVNLETHSQLTASPAFLQEAIASYNEQRKGILTNPGSDFVAFTKLPTGALPPSTRDTLDSSYGPDWPDIELVPFDNNIVSSSTDGRNYVTSLAILVAPFSRGTVSISSTSTLENPIVSPNWLVDPRDRDVAIAGFRYARQIFAQAEIQSIVNGGEEVSPGANVTSDEAILEVIQQTLNTINHPAATCRMGKPGDKEAAVDSQSRVFGVGRLRVVDASAFPFLPPGHPQATVYALAEKIAEDIIIGNQPVVGTAK